MEIDTGTPDGHRPPDAIGTEPARSRRGRRGAAIAVGAVVLAGGGSAAALAAGTSPSPAPGSGSPTPSYGAPSPGATPPAPGKGFGRERRGGFEGLTGGALHGTLTVPSTGKTYEQVLVQRGTVTAVSPTSLSVKSADGYTHTYTLSSSTRIDGKAGDTSSLAVDDTVGVLAASDSAARLVTERRAVTGRPEGTPPSGAPGRLPGEGLRRHGAAPGEATPDGVAPSPSASGSSRTLPGTTAGGSNT